MIFGGHRNKNIFGTVVATGILALAPPVMAEQLYDGSDWSAMAADRRASQIGDIVTVLIASSSLSSSQLQNSSQRSTDLGGGVRAGGVSEEASIEFGGS